MKINSEVKSYVVVAKNGEMAVAIPLFTKTIHNTQAVFDIKIDAEVISEEPTAFILDMGDQISLFNFDVVNNNLEFLSEL